MATIRATERDTTARSTNERFLELVCAVEDLLRAEFDAIVTAEWPDPPPDQPDRGDRRPEGQ